MPDSDAPLSLLLVEDDPTMRLFLTRLLQNAYAVTSVETGQAALDWCADEGLPDLLVLDLGLPDRPGHDVLAALRDAHGLDGMGVLVLSGDESSEASVQSLALGADDHLDAPFNPEELRLRLTRVHPPRT